MQNEPTAAKALATLRAHFLKKRRGRPPTTGQYVGLAKTKRALLEQEERKLQLLAERQLLEEEREKREARARFSKEVASEDVGADHDGPRRSVLLREATDAVDTICKVAAKSSNLKGTFQKMLKSAAKSIADATKELAALSSTEEITSLERENKRLRSEMAEIKAEMAALREEIRGVRLRPVESSRTAREETAAPQLAANTTREDMEVVKVHQPPSFSMPSPSTNRQESSVLGQREEAVMGGLLRQIGDMMAAKFAAIEDRLLPEKRLRPPLGKSSAKAAEQPAANSTIGSLADLPRRVMPRRAAKEQKSKGSAPPRDGGRKKGVENFHSSSSSGTQDAPSGSS
jgi:predicted  nucleic acid-binding Zn-ribbon protein